MLILFEIIYILHTKNGTALHSNKRT